MIEERKNRPRGTNGSSQVLHHHHRRRPSLSKRSAAAPPPVVPPPPAPGTRPGSKLLKDLTYIEIDTHRESGEGMSNELFMNQRQACQ